MWKILISLAFGASLLTACSGFSGFQLDIQQGNVIEDEKVTQLRVGMTPEQVRFLLGSPVVQPVFIREERWDYVYFRNSGSGSTERRRVSIFFDAGRVVRIEDTQ